MIKRYLRKKEKDIFIGGADEAGRGPLAGPVVGAVVLMKVSGSKLKIPNLKFKDSKKLKPKEREEIFNWLKSQKEIKFAYSFVSSKVIDKINILKATILTWKRSLKKFEKPPEILFVDGNQTIPNLKIRQVPVVGGDRKIFVITLASIVAKVVRDRFMEKIAKKYPCYQFEIHKGYPTKKHLNLLKKFNASQIHRKSFRPVFETLSFKERVLFIVSKIKKGEVLSYQKVAELAGNKKATRVVGNILSKNFDKNIPCHRVIRKDGSLGGYNRGISLKKFLLKKEIKNF